MSSVSFFVVLAVLAVSAINVGSSDVCPDVDAIPNLDVSKLYGEWYVWKWTTTGFKAQDLSCVKRTYTLQDDRDVQLDVTFIDNVTNEPNRHTFEMIVGESDTATFPDRNATNVEKIQTIGDNFEYIIWLTCVNDGYRLGYVTMIIVQDLDVGFLKWREIKRHLDPAIVKALVTVNQRHCTAN